MNKIRNVDCYKNVVEENSEFFKNYYYHSIIDLNLTKLASILEHGILSKDLINEKTLINIFTHHGDSFESKNGNKYVSIAEYIGDYSFHGIFDSFPFHTLTSPSVMISKKIKTEKSGERETCFDDELFCLNSISKHDFEGILIPEHLLSLPINEVSCLASDYSCYTKSYINNWIAKIQRYFDAIISKNDICDIKNSFEQLKLIFNNYESPERYISSALNEQRELYGKELEEVLANILCKLWSKKFNIDNPTYIEVLNRINNEQLPIYVIKQKCLKRIV